MLSFVLASLFLRSSTAGTVGSAAEGDPSATSGDDQVRPSQTRLLVEEGEGQPTPAPTPAPSPGPTAGACRFAASYDWTAPVSEGDNVKPKLRLLQADEACGTCHGWCFSNSDGTPRAPPCAWKGACDGCAECCPSSATLGPTPVPPPRPPSGLIRDQSVQEEYIKFMLTWDGKFATVGQGISQTALTCDHVDLAENGAPKTTFCYTAASKESLHIEMLALVVSGRRLAWHWIASAANEDNARTIAIQRLQQIIGSYERLNQAFPGLGGFIPWISVENNGFKLDSETAVMLPALDNGQLAWAMVAAAHALKVAGQGALAARYDAHINLMTSSAPVLFLNPASGRVWMEVTVTHARAPLSSANRAGKGQLGDPYEGELMLMFLDMFCAWPDPSRKSKMWEPVKQNQIMVKYDHPGLPNGPISVQRGWRFSSHELWKYMVLPYTDNEHARRVLANGERARTWNSKLKGIPGLLASAYNSNHQYIDRYGVESISMGYPEPPQSGLHVTPYGAYPLMLADLGYGLAWHRAMLGRPRMQSVLGSVESSKAFGDPQVAAYTSWDTKVTSDLAALGGVGALIRSKLQSEPAKLARFTALVQELYAPYFPTLEGEDTPFAEPPGLAQSDDLASSSPVDFANCERLTPVQKKIGFLGCFDNSGADRLWGQEADFSVSECEAKALKYNKPLFGLEYPQGSPEDGDAQCLLLDGTPTLKEVPAAECKAEVDSDGHPLGSAYRLAVYTYNHDPNWKAKLGFLGCFANTWADKLWGHEAHLSFSECEAKALKYNKPLFGLEYPQGSPEEGDSSCLLLEGTPTVKEVPAAECQGEVDSDRHPLGSFDRLAVYTREARDPAGKLFEEVGGTPLASTGFPHAGVTAVAVFSAFSFAVLFVRSLQRRWAARLGAAQPYIRMA